eukprot:1137520-Pelagomonas_calceolata.AAC.2
MSELLDLLLTGMDQPQADQPNNMAGGLPVYGIPAGMYACQVWGTEYLQEGSEFKSQLQKRCEEYCHELASIERMWPRALT